MTLLADRSEISCSADRPPKRRPTRIFLDTVSYLEKLQQLLTYLNINIKIAYQTNFNRPQSVSIGLSYRRINPTLPQGFVYLNDPFSDTYKPASKKFF